MSRPDKAPPGGLQKVSLLLDILPPNQYTKEEKRMTVENVL